MHYIDLDTVELNLPNNWDNTVANAKSYVADKIAAAEIKALAYVLTKSWTQAQIDIYILEEKIKARKTAITAKSSVWSSISHILSEQSSGKCWYCETYEIRSDNPIDHFRPKNKVVECPGHDGYFWLAFNWRNYRYACTYCNSRRVEVTSAGGKHDHFPLLSPKIWNQCEADTNIEQPVLLDPCDIADCMLLTFNINGYACPSTLDDTSEEYSRAAQSINLYHLNYEPTKKARRIIYQQVKNLINNTNKLIDDGVSLKHDQIKSNKKELIKMIRPVYQETQFNTAAKTYLKEYKQYDWVEQLINAV